MINQNELNNIKTNQERCIANQTNNYQNKCLNNQYKGQFNGTCQHSKLIRYVIQKNKLIRKRQWDNPNQYDRCANDVTIKGCNLHQLNMSKVSGGEINSVYEIQKDFIIKIQQKIQGITLHQPQLLLLAEKAKVKCPKLVDYGSYQGKNYILMTKIQGQRLWRYWPLLTQQQKQNAIKQICIELKKLHSIKFKLFSSQRPQQFPTMYDALKQFNRAMIQGITQQQIHKLDKQTLANLQKLFKFIDQNIAILIKGENEQQQPVFVHNDMHFGNVLYDPHSHQITGIVDFDFSRQLAKDYQLWHLIDVFNLPLKYVQEGQEHKWKNFKIQNQIRYFKKYYHELFQEKHDKITTKIRLYLADQMITMIHYQDYPMFNQKFYSFYQSNWLEEFLKM